MDWYLKVVRDNFSNFQGRARRKEYWMFVLFQVLIYFSSMALMAGVSAINEWLGMVVGLVLIAYWLITLIPWAAVLIRRLHDMGNSGWWLFILLVPFGNLFLLIMLCMDSEKDENQFGPNPKS